MWREERRVWRTVGSEVVGGGGSSKSFRLLESFFSGDIASFLGEEVRVFTVNVSTQLPSLPFDVLAIGTLVPRNPSPLKRNDALIILTKKASIWGNPNRVEEKLGMTRVWSYPLERNEAVMVWWRFVIIVVGRTVLILREDVDEDEDGGLIVSMEVDDVRLKGSESSK